MAGWELMVTFRGKYDIGTDEGLTLTLVFIQSPVKA